MSWLPIWGPSIAAVVVSALFTISFGVFRYWRHQRGIRALVSQEVLHNQTALLAFRESLLACLREGEPDRIVSAFYSTMSAPIWSHARWDLSDVGETFSPPELLRLAEWYVKLDGLAFLYYRASEMLMRLVTRRSPSGITLEQAQGMVVHITGLVDYANSLITDPPPLPDARFRHDSRSVRSYMEELDRKTRAESQEGDGEQ